MATRRRFLHDAAAAVAATAWSPRPAAAAEAAFDPRSWSSVRAEFALDPKMTNFATFLLASHPRPVRNAIARHARLLDRDAKHYLDRRSPSSCGR
jgi:hypothetical protein